MKNIFKFLIALTAVAFTSHAQDTWVQKSDFGYNAPNVPGPSARDGAVAFSIGSKGYIGTGDEDGVNKKDFWEYDPDTDAWSQKADFGGTARWGAVGFSNGVKGYAGTGYDGVDKNDFWEYDPEANTWTQKADFQGSARSSATGFSIGSKGYIGTGAEDLFYYKKDFWEYDPDANSWNQKADFGGTARKKAVSFSIDGKGYIGTGSVGYDYKKDLWEYDPDANIWIQKADFEGEARGGAVGFTIGNKGYIGTGVIELYGSDDYNSDFWEYDPFANMWTQKADFGSGGRGYAVGFSIGSKGYIGTGFVDSPFGISYEYFDDLWEFDSNINTWTQKVETARPAATGFSIGSKGYIGTGYNYPSPYKDFWEYDPNANTWTQKADFGGTARSNAVGFSIGNKGYIGTGKEDFYNYKKDFWEYDPDANTWTQKADFGGSARHSATGFSISSKGYIGTGMEDFPDYKKDFWEYDPISDTWVQRADFGGSVRHGASGFGIGNKGYMGTGYGNSIIYKDFWEYDSEADTWIQKADFGGDARYFAASFSINSKGYIGTGYNYPSPYKDFWEYDPDADSWTQKANFEGSARWEATGFSIGSKGYIGIGQDDNGYIKDFWEYSPDGVAPCSIPTSLSTIKISATTAKLQWVAVSGAIGYKVRYKIAGTSEWTNIQSIDNDKTLKGLTAATEYVWQVKSICSMSPIVSSEWSEKQFFTTGSLRSGALEDVSFPKEVDVYPNPFISSTTISFSLQQDSKVQIELYDVAGKNLRTVLDENVVAGNTEVNLNRDQLSAGIYFIRISINGEVTMKKVVIQ